MGKLVNEVTNKWFWHST